MSGFFDVFLQASAAREAERRFQRDRQLALSGSQQVDRITRNQRYEDEFAAQEQQIAQQRELAIAQFQERQDRQDARAMLEDTRRRELAAQEADLSQQRIDAQTARAEQSSADVDKRIEAQNERAAAAIEAQGARQDKALEQQRKMFDDREAARAEQERQRLEAKSAEEIAKALEKQRKDAAELAVERAEYERLTSEGVTPDPTLQQMFDEGDAKAGQLMNIQMRRQQAADKRIAAEAEKARKKQGGEKAIEVNRKEVEDELERLSKSPDALAKYAISIFGSEGAEMFVNLWPTWEEERRARFVINQLIKRRLAAAKATSRVNVEGNHPSQQQAPTPAREVPTPPAAPFPESVGAGQGRGIQPKANAQADAVDADYGSYINEQLNQGIPLEEAQAKFDLRQPTPFDALLPNYKGHPQSGDPSTIAMDNDMSQFDRDMELIAEADKTSDPMGFLRAQARRHRAEGDIHRAERFERAMAERGLQVVPEELKGTEGLPDLPPEAKQSADTREEILARPEIKALRESVSSPEEAKAYYDRVQYEEWKEGEPARRRQAEREAYVRTRIEELSPAKRAVAEAAVRSDFFGEDIRRALTPPGEGTVSVETVERVFNQRAIEQEDAKEDEFRRKGLMSDKEFEALVALWQSLPDGPAKDKLDELYIQPRQRRMDSEALGYRYDPTSALGEYQGERSDYDLFKDAQTVTAFRRDDGSVLSAGLAALGTPGAFYERKLYSDSGKATELEKILVDFATFGGAADAQGIAKLIIGAGRKGGAAAQWAGSIIKMLADTTPAERRAVLRALEAIGQEMADTVTRAASSLKPAPGFGGRLKAAGRDMLDDLLPKAKDDTIPVSLREADLGGGPVGGGDYVSGAPTERQEIAIFEREARAADAKRSFAPGSKAGTPGIIPGRRVTVGVETPIPTRQEILLEETLAGLSQAGRVKQAGEAAGTPGIIPGRRIGPGIEIPIPSRQQQLDDAIAQAEAMMGRQQRQAAAAATEELRASSEASSSLADILSRQEPPRVGQQPLAVAGDVEGALVRSRSGSATKTAMERLAENKGAPVELPSGHKLSGTAKDGRLVYTNEAGGTQVLTPNAAQAKAGKAIEGSSEEVVKQLDATTPDEVSESVGKAIEAGEPTTPRALESVPPAKQPEAAVEAEAAIEARTGVQPKADLLRDTPGLTKNAKGNYSYKGYSITKTKGEYGERPWLLKAADGTEIGYYDSLKQVVDDIGESVTAGKTVPESVAIADDLAKTVELTPEKIQEKLAAYRQRGQRGSASIRDIAVTAGAIGAGSTAYAATPSDNPLIKTVAAATAAASVLGGAALTKFMLARSAAKFQADLPTIMQAVRQLDLRPVAVDARDMTLGAIDAQKSVFPTTTPDLAFPTIYARDVRPNMTRYEVVRGEVAEWTKGAYSGLDAEDSRKIHEYLMGTRQLNNPELRNIANFTDAIIRKVTGSSYRSGVRAGAEANASRNAIEMIDRGLHNIYFRKSGVAKKLRSLLDARSDDAMYRAFRWGSKKWHLQKWVDILENGHDSGGWVTEMLVRNLYRSTIGLNTGTIFKNVTQTSNDLITHGVRNYVDALSDIFTDFRGGRSAVKGEVEAALGAQVSSGPLKVGKAAGAISDVEGMMTASGQAPGLTKGMEVYDKVLFGGMEATEKLNRFISFYTGMKAAAKKGLAGADAVEYALNSVSRHQGHYSALLRAPIFHGPIGKMFGALLTFQGRQLAFTWETLTRRAATTRTLATGAAEFSAAERARQKIRLAMAAGVATAAAELTPIDLSFLFESLPFYSPELGRDVIAAARDEREFSVGKAALDIGENTLKSVKNPMQDLFSGLFTGSENQRWQLMGILGPLPIVEMQRLYRYGGGAMSGRPYMTTADSKAIAQIWADRFRGMTESDPEGWDAVYGNGDREAGRQVREYMNRTEWWLRLLGVPTRQMAKYTEAKGALRRSGRGTTRNLIDAIMTSEQVAPDLLESRLNEGNAAAVGAVRAAQRARTSPLTDYLGISTPAGTLKDRIKATIDLESQ